MAMFRHRTTETEKGLSFAVTAEGHMMLINQSDVAYGGVLRELYTDVKENDTDVSRVIQFAVQYAEKYHMPKDGSGKPEEPLVTNLEKMRLQATRDGKTQHSLVQTRSIGATQQFQRRKVIYGMTYSFSLSWGQTEHAPKHHFVVSLDRERNMYLFAHTVQSENLQGTSPGVDQVCESGKDADPLHKSAPELDGSATSQSDCTAGHGATPTGQSDCTSTSERAQNVGGELEREDADTITTCESAGGEAKQRWSGAHELSVATQNIWNFNGHGRPSAGDEAYRERMASLGELVGRLGADVLGLQEVRFEVSRGGPLGPCQAQHVAHHLPDYQYVYQPAVSYVADDFERREEGLAIFSRHPIVSHDFILLSRDVNDEEDKDHQRICLHAEIVTPALGVVHVFVTHLSLSAAARERSVLEIWDFMAKHPGPAILIGDFNDHPQSKIIRFLSGLEEINGIQTDGLQDAWLMKNKEPRTGPRAYANGEPIDEGLTFSTLNEHLNKRIDYIFVRLPENMQMTGISLVDDGKRGPMAASDHLGLQASIAAT